MAGSSLRVLRTTRRAAGLRPAGGAAARSPGSGQASPVGVSLSLSPSRALSSRPHIRVWSAAAAVSAGPGRSQWRLREAERRPRAAPSPRNFRLPKPHNFAGGRGRKGKPRREARGTRPSELRGRRLLTHAEPATAQNRAPPAASTTRACGPAGRPCRAQCPPAAPGCGAGARVVYAGRGGRRPRRRWKA